VLVLERVWPRGQGRQNVAVHASGTPASLSALPAKVTAEPLMVTPVALISVEPALRCGLVVSDLGAGAPQRLSLKPPQT